MGPVLHPLLLPPAGPWIRSTPGPAPSGARCPKRPPSHPDCRPLAPSAAHFIRCLPICSLSPKPLQAGIMSALSSASGASPAHSRCSVHCGQEGTAAGSSRQVGAHCHTTHSNPAMDGEVSVLVPGPGDDGTADELAQLQQQSSNAQK